MLILMQGVPGSGKTTLAKQLKSFLSATRVSTDDYFMIDGVYCFDPDKLPEYHTRTQLAARELMKDGKNVIVDNTNSKRWYVQPYVNDAVLYGHWVVSIVCFGAFDSIHSVPVESVQGMRDSREELFADFHVDYHPTNSVLASSQFTIGRHGSICGKCVTAQRLAWELKRLISAVKH